MTTSHELSFLKLELIPSSWAQALRERGFQVEYDYRNLTATVKGKRGRRVTVEVNHKDGSKNYWWYVKYTWGERLKAEWASSLHEAGVWVEDFVSICEFWDRKRDEIQLAWKEFILTQPVKDLKLENPGPPNKVGYVLYSCHVPNKSGRSGYDNRSLSYVAQVRYSVRHSRPWCLQIHNKWRSNTYRFKTYDGLFKRMVREVNE